MPFGWVTHVPSSQTSQRSAPQMVSSGFGTHCPLWQWTHVPPHSALSWLVWHTPFRQIRHTPHPVSSGLVWHAPSWQVWQTPHDVSSARATHDPPWHRLHGLPHAAPSGSFFLPLPLLRLRHGGQGFFFAPVAVTAATSAAPKANPISIRARSRREGVDGDTVIERSRASKRVPSMGLPTESRRVLLPRGTNFCCWTIGHWSCWPVGDGAGWARVAAFCGVFVRREERIWRGGRRGRR